MPLFQVQGDHLDPYEPVPAGPELYEVEIEELLWNNLDAVLGEKVFPVGRQVDIPGGTPDIVVLDESARVVVIEVKRDMDRRQLAQCLEYAGWARTTGLDELAGLYTEGAETFFARWQAFTDTGAPVIINSSPRLILVARDYDERTRSALDFLRSHGVPITVVAVSVHEDPEGVRHLAVDLERPPDEPGSPASVAPAPTEGWSFDAYEQILNVAPERVAVARELFESVSTAIAQLGLPWTPKFNKGYVAFLRPGEYKTVVIDVYWSHAPRLAVKLPVPLPETGLVDPFPDLTNAWSQSEKEWGWTVPPGFGPLDVRPAIELCALFHPITGPMLTKPPLASDG